MVLKNLRAIVGDNRLKLPVGDKLYAIPALSALNWIWLKAVWEKNTPDVPAEKSDDASTAEQPEQPSEDPGPSEEELFTRVLGRVYQELMDDGATFEEVRVVGMTAVIDAIHGRPLAEAYWETGGIPGNPPARTEDQIRADLDTATPAAPSTRRRASRSGATAPKKAPARRGRTASTSGT